jgi:cysteine desulfurase / selenocysteine lyase
MPNPIYLNTAACGLVMPETLVAANQLYSGFEHNSSTMSAEGRIRQTIADFLGAEARSIAMVPNFSWAWNGIVHSLKGSEKVLLYRRDYPSLLEPFRINHFDITWVDATDGFNIDVDAVKDAITNKRVDIVALSHVQWSSGYKADIKAIGELCKDNGVLFMVDATQSMGANELDIAQINVDVFAASNYKWMNAGFGTAVLYIADGFLEKYQPVVGGHNSYKMVDGLMQYTPSVQSYEPGHPNMYGLTVLESAIKHKMELGVANIQNHNYKLTEQFLMGIEHLPVNILGDYSMNHRTAIVLLKDEERLGDHIKKHNIVVTQRIGMLRVSMHYYNTAEHVQALVDCLKGKFE